VPVSEIEGGVNASNPTHLLLLNNYRASGIGDFGGELLNYLDKGTTRYIETRTDGVGELRQLREAISWKGTLLLNVGLTAWGKSRIRNLVGFSGLSIRVNLRRKTIVFAHNLIEGLDPESSGFAVTRSVRVGAHQAIAGLRRAKIVTFSPILADLLVQLYDTAPSLVTPIPCLPARRAIPPLTLHRRVITPGYLSPYKGHHWIPDVKALLPSDVEFMTIGGAHRLLMETDARYRSDHERLLERLVSAGVDVRGWVPDDDMDRLLGESAVALLPYSSTQGGTAMFSRLASVGTPVVAPRIPAFEWLGRLGAGALLVEPTAQEFANGIRRILDDPTLRNELSDRQSNFARGHSWRRFTELILAME
jgi:glycosyltransferase involved in cell wall biosynthesis